MKVLHLNSGNLFGGIENLLVTLAEQRAACPGMTVEFACAFDGRAAATLRSKQVPVHILGGAKLSRPWTILEGRRQIAKLLRAGAYQAVICHVPWTLGIYGPAIKRQGALAVFWSHDQSPRPLSPLERFATWSRPDLIIHNSGYSASGQPLFAGVPGEVLYCPVPPAPPHAASAREQVRLRHGASATDAVILQVSRLDPHKGHRLHLEALGQLRERRDWVCWMISGAQRPAEELLLAQLQARAIELQIADRVRFLPWQADLAELFAAADIYCQPNVAPEPFGLTFIEALWHGLPVIGTKLGGPLEIIDETCGLLVEAGQSCELAAALESLIADPQRRATLGDAGPARASKLCAPQQQVMRLEALLKAAGRN